MVFNVLTLPLFFALTSTICSAMQIIEIKNPLHVYFLKKNFVTIGGEHGCILYDIVTKESTMVTQKPIFCMAAHPQGHLLAIKLFLNNTINIVNTNTKKVEESVTSTDRTIAFGPDGNCLFGRDSYKTFTNYNYDNKTIQKHIIDWDPKSSSFTHIACHPTKNEIAYPSEEKNISIAQPRHSPFVKTRLITNLTTNHCLGGKYSGDGLTLAMRFNAPISNLYFIYSLKLASTIAYEIDSGVEATFHPNYNLLALLSPTNIIKLYNYETRQLVAETSALSTVNINCCTFTNRLAFCPNGKKIIAALEKECVILNVPQNNFFEAFYALNNNLLKDLVNIVMQQIIAMTNDLQWPYINITELLKVRKLQQPIAEQAKQTEKKTQEKTEEINITCIRKE